MGAVSEHRRCERRLGCYKCSWNHALAAYLPTFQMFKVIDLADRPSLVPMAACSCRASCPLTPCFDVDRSFLLLLAVFSPSLLCWIQTGSQPLPIWILLLLFKETSHHWSPEPGTLLQWLCACHFSNSRNFTITKEGICNVFVQRSGVGRHISRSPRDAI